MKAKEKPGEKKIIHVLDCIGFEAKHIDCNIDGFPDIIALGRDVAILIEMKGGPLDTLLIDAFEPTQPVWQMRVLRRGFRHTFQVLYDGDEYHVFQDKMLHKKILTPGVRFSDLHIIASGDAWCACAAIVGRVGCE